MACRKCGECCKYTTIFAGEIDEDGRRWAEYHGHKIVETKRGTVLFVPNRCSQLRDDNTCAIYEDRPRNCVAMPIRDLLDFHPPECQYYDD